MTKVKTRFEVTPGILNLNDVRNIVINSFFAERNEGHFSVRFKNTRFPKINILKNIEDLEWLKIPCDFKKQSDSLLYYKKKAENLIKMGLAYPDNSCKEPRGTNRNMSSDQAYSLYDDTGWNIRFKIPEGKIVYKDWFMGEINWDCRDIRDPIIFEGDYPSNIFASTIDDAEENITHVFQTKHHLNECPTRFLIAESLGYIPPIYGHYSMIEFQDYKITKEAVGILNQIGFNDAEIHCRGELSPLNLAYYQALGYLPQAVINAVFNNKFMPINHILRDFEFDKNIVLNQRDIKVMNFTHLKSIEVDINECVNFMILSKKFPKDKCEDIAKICAKSIEVYSDILTHSYFFEEPKNSQKLLREYFDLESVKEVNKISYLLEDVVPWERKTIEKAVLDFNQYAIYSLRIALTGTLTGPPLFKIMELMDRKTCINRFRNFKYE